MLFNHQTEHLIKENKVLRSKVDEATHPKDLDACVDLIKGLLVQFDADQRVQILHEIDYCTDCGELKTDCGCYDD